jgi:hypothetical protein
MVVFLLPILKVVWTLIPGKRKLAKQAFDAVPGKRKAATFTGKWICIYFLAVVLSISLISGVIFGVVEWRRHEDEKKAELASNTEYAKRFYGDEAMSRDYWGTKRQEPDGEIFDEAWRIMHRSTSDEVHGEGASRENRRRKRGLERFASVR